MRSGGRDHGSAQEAAQAIAVRPGLHAGAVALWLEMMMAAAAPVGGAEYPDMERGRARERRSSACRFRKVRPGSGPKRTGKETRAFAHLCGRIPQAGPCSTLRCALYENHCRACHTQRVHARSDRVHPSAGALREIVDMWQREKELQWGAREIDDMVYFQEAAVYKSR